ncbi:MAG: hypothetical protein KDE58_17640 [Caldilineaceae bacterium]|nr:hypothetical protein [Caldilineaceae bacterium]
MPDLTTVPLPQLLASCRPLTQQLAPADEAVWRELLRRALLQRNDSAWDALVQRLWPVVLHWTYLGLPDTSPAEVERVAQLAIWTFLQEQLASNVPSASSPNAGVAVADTDETATSPPSIAAQLQQVLQRLLP